MRCSSCGTFLQLALEIRERRHSALGELVDPSVVDEPDGHGVEVVELFPSDLPRDDETGVLEDAEVLHDAEARHLQLGLQLRERAAVTLEEPVEQEPPRR